MSFEDESEMQATRNANAYHSQPETIIGWSALFDTFVAGAQWGREKGFQEAVEMLRSDNAPRDAAPLYPYNHFWADWLEEQEKE